MFDETEELVGTQAKNCFRKASKRLGNQEYVALNGMSLRRIAPISEILVFDSRLLRFAIGPTNTVAFNSDGSAERITSFEPLNILLDNKP